MTSTPTITIVGAGSAGLRLAQKLASYDIPITVYEDHPEIGIPEHCSGLISARNTQTLGFDLRESFTNDIYGAKIFSPNNTQLRIERNKPVAHVMDRSLFDKTLYKQAIKAGANIELSTSVINVKGNTLFTQAKGKGGMRKSDIIVAADGVNSRLRKIAGIESQPGHFIHSYQVKAAGHFDPRFVELYLGNKFAPHFFAWVIPENEESAKVGIGCKVGTNPVHAFNAFLKEKQIDIHVKNSNSFLIPCALPIKNLVNPPMILLGDAAYQTKATSVDYEEPILIEEDGFLKNIRIGELIDRELAKATKKEVIEGKNPVTIGLPSNTIRAYSPAPDASSPSMREIRSVLKHPIDDPLYEIVLEKGYRVRVTGSHSVMIAKNDQFVGKKVSELRVGTDFIPVTLSVPKKNSIRSIDLVSLIQKHPRRNEFSKVIKVKGKRDLLYQKSTYVPKGKSGLYWSNNSIPLFEFFDKGVVLENVPLFYENSDILVSSKIDLTPELCRLLGYYVAEGGCSGGVKINLAFGINDIENGTVEDALTCIAKTFDVPVLKSMKHNPITNEINGVNLEFGGKMLAIIFSELLAAGKSASIKEVPYILFNASEKFKLEFFKGYLRGDGTIRIRKGIKRKNWSAEISCKTVSRKLASDLVLLSLQLDLFPSIETFTVPARLWNGKKIGESNGFKIIFSGKTDLTRLLDIFPNLRDDLSTFLEKIDEREKISIPKELIQDIDGQRYGGPFYSEFGPGISAYKTVALARVRRAFQQIESKNSRHQFILNMAQSRIALLRIKSIKEVQPTRGEVFDVEIPETQMFVGGMGPLLLHNTGGGIIMNCKSADILAGVLHEHVTQGTSLDEYPKRMEPIFKELEMHYKIHQYQSKMTDEQLDQFFLKIKDAGAEQFLSKEGDMDEPTRFIGKLLGNPRMISLLPEALQFWMTK